MSRSPVPTVCVPAYALGVTSCGTLVMSRFKVTLPLVPPPVRSVPALTPVMVPPPLIVLQTHPLPLQLSTCPLEQALVRDRFNVPLVPPPIRPLPLAVPTPVIVPVPGKVWPLTKLTRPVLLTR